MKKNYLFPILLIFGIILLSNQNIKAQSGLQNELLQANLDQIIGSIKDDGTVVIPEIEIRNEVITVAPPNSTKTTYFEDKDGDGYTSGKTIEDFPGLDIPGYKEIMFLDIGSIVKNTVTGASFLVFDCDDNNTNIVRGMFYYEDKDGDGYITNSPPITACTKPDGYTSEENIKGIDCDDNTFNSEKPTTTYYFDSDGDGYPFSFGEYCEKPVGYKSAAELVSTETDCNDDNKDVWEKLEYYDDIDKDGYHGSSSSFCVGTEPNRTNLIQGLKDRGVVFATLGPDCDDFNPEIGLYQPIRFLRSLIKSITIEGCSIDDVGNETIPTINTLAEFIRTSEAVLREAGARIAEGYCSILRVSYQDKVNSANPDGSIQFRRTFITVDNLANFAYFSQNYIIRDITKPTISPLADITAENDTGKCGAAKENVLVSPYVFDNCTLVGDLVITNNAPDFLEVGEHSVEWSVKDKAGNIQKAVQKVTVVDTEPPMVRTKNITVALSSKNNTVIVVQPSMINNESTDNCGIIFPTSNFSFDCSNLGENIVTLVLRDAVGNTSSAPAIITVIDNTSPTWNTTMPDLDASCDFIPAPLAPFAVDNCDFEPEVFWLESSGQDSNPNNIGHYNYTITWTWIARDVSGNSSIDLIQKVNVSDNDAPTIESLKSIEASCSKIPDPITPGVKDNCDPNPLITFSESSDQNPDLSNVGHYNYTITRKWTAIDVSGNQSESTQMVNVFDDQGPEWVSSKSSMDITLNCGEEFELAEAQSQLPIALDNCDQYPIITKTSGMFVPGLFSGQGSFTNTFIATDASGNETTEFRQVISILPPSFACPANIVTNVALGVSAKVVTYDLDLPNFNENCGLLSIELTEGLESGGVFPLGTTTVSYEATDEAGNKTSCSFTVTVTEDADAMDPVINNCPADITLANNAGECSATVTWTAPTATDNSGSVTLTSNFGPGAVFPVGTTEVIYSATDAAGNQVTCSFNVTVTDNELPVINPVADITVNIPSTESSANVNVVTPSASDICGSATVTGVRNDGRPLTDSYPVGETTITWSAVDASGNLSVDVLQKVIVNQVSTNQRVVRFVLVNAATNQDLFELTEGMQISESLVQGLRLSVRAETDPAIVGSVFMRLTGAVNTSRTENVAPYALFGDNNGNYSGRMLPTGNYTMYSMPFTQSSRRGTAGDPLTVNFSIVASVVPVTGITVSPSTSTVEVGNNVQLTATVSPSNATNKAVTWSSSNGSVASVNFDGLVTGNAVGQAVITATTEDGGFMASATITVESVPNLGIVSFTLINSANNQDMFELTDGMVIDESQTIGLRLNIRANTNPSIVGSVYFTLSGPVNRNATENVAPYALFGDKNGNYSGRTLPAGTYTLSARAYSDRNRRGTAGPIKTISFTINSNVVRLGDGQASDNNGNNSETNRGGMEGQSPEIMRGSLKIYPNPAKTESNILIHLSGESEVTIRIFDATGRSVYEEQGRQSGTFTRNLDLRGLSSGMYHVVVQIDNKVLTGRLVRDL